MTVFELAEQIELTIAEIYKMLASRFVDNGDLRALFTLLAQEELAHARRVKEVANAWDDEDGDGWSLDLEESHMQQLLDKAEDALAMTLQRTNLSGKEALEMTDGLEQAFHAAHAEALAADIAPELQSLFEELASADSAHLELIARAKRGGFPPPKPDFRKIKKA